MATAKAMAFNISAIIHTALIMVKLKKEPDLSSLIQVPQKLLSSISALSASYFKTLSVTKGKMDAYRAIFFNDRKNIL
jgi:hypothetical protein